MQPIIDQVESLLVQAEQAHGQYEQTILNGIYDQDWPNWYANSIIEQGIEKVLNRSLSREKLGQFLSQSYEQFDAPVGKAEGFPAPFLIKSSNLRKPGLPIPLKS